jgi:hypothetical protein
MLRLLFFHLLAAILSYDLIIMGFWSSLWFARMTGSLAGRRDGILRRCSRIRAARACSTKSIGSVWADCVEKLVIFDPLMLVITLISFGCS